VFENNQRNYKSKKSHHQKKETHRFWIRKIQCIAIIFVSLWRKNSRVGFVIIKYSPNPVFRIFLPFLQCFLAWMVLGIHYNRFRILVSFYEVRNSGRDKLFVPFHPEPILPVFRLLGFRLQT